MRTRYIRALQALVVTSVLLLFHPIAIAGKAANEIEKYVAGSFTIPLAVQRLTGSGDSYEMGFSGWVGSLQMRLEEKRIYMVQITDLKSSIPVMIGIYNITALQKYPESIDFECVDNSAPASEWRGRVWLEDHSRLRFEMVQKHTSGRWVNLDQHGKHFLKKAGLERLFLGR